MDSLNRLRYTIDETKSEKRERGEMMKDLDSRILIKEENRDRDQQPSSEDLDIRRSSVSSVGADSMGRRNSNFDDDELIF